MIVSPVQVKYVFCSHYCLIFLVEDTPYPHEVPPNATIAFGHAQHVSPVMPSLPPPAFQASHDVAGPSNYAGAFYSLSYDITSRI